MTSFFVTLGTVGYGDLHPTTDLSKIFTAAYPVAGGGIFVRFITKVAALRTHHHHFQKDKGEGS